MGVIKLRWVLRMCCKASYHVAVTHVRGSRGRRTGRWDGVTGSRGAWEGMLSSSGFAFLRSVCCYMLKAELQQQKINSKEWGNPIILSFVLESLVDGMRLAFLSCLFWVYKPEVLCSKWHCR